jgi:hypothetical protein
MKTKTNNYHLNTELTLCESLQSPLTIRAVTLALTKEVHKIIECRLTFQVSPEIYQRIDKQALFNLKPEIRSPLYAGAFQPEPDIQIEASLDPDLLPRLAKHAADVNHAAAYLQSISRDQPDDPLLSTHSWYGLKVKQQQETCETGYRTLWAYISPPVLTQDGISSEQISEGMANFIKEWTDASQSGMAQDAISKTVEKMTNVFEELADSLSKMTQNAISQTLEEVTSVFEELADSHLRKPKMPLITAKSLRKWSVSSKRTTDLSPRLKESQPCAWLSRARMENGIATPRLELNRSNSSFTQFAQV